MRTIEPSVCPGHAPEGGIVSTVPLSRRPLQQLPEVIFSQAHDGQDVAQSSLGQIPSPMDRYRNGPTVRVPHDVVAATDPNHLEAGSFQRSDDFTPGTAGI